MAKADGCGSFRVTDGLGPEPVLALRCAEIEPLVLAGEVEGQYSSKSPLLITARRVRMASAPSSPTELR